MRPRALLLGAVAAALTVAVASHRALDPTRVGVEPLPLDRPTLPAALTLDPPRLAAYTDEAPEADWTLRVVIPAPGVTRDGHLTIRFPIQVLNTGADATYTCPQIPQWVGLPSGRRRGISLGAAPDGATVEALGHWQQLRLALGLFVAPGDGPLTYSVKEALCHMNRAFIRPGRAGFVPGDVIEVKFKGFSRPKALARAAVGVEMIRAEGAPPVLLVPAPVLEFTGAEIAALRVVAPSVVWPGEMARVVVQGLDRAGRLCETCGGRVHLDLPAGAVAAGGLDVELVEGQAAVDVSLPAGGPWRIGAKGERGVVGEGNPTMVDGARSRVFWGDLHRHSVLADGWAHPDEVYRRARDVERLDFASLSEHSHPDPMDRFGILRRRLLLSPFEWATILDTTDRWNTPPTFTTLHGWEWSGQTGHRNVYLPPGEDPGPLVPFYAADGETAEPSPGDLFQALAGRRALVIPHHPAFHDADDPPFEWALEADGGTQRLVEVYSEHGDSERPGGPRPLHGNPLAAPAHPLIGLFIRGNVLGPADAAPPGDGSWVVDALARGAPMGLIASSDSHFGPTGPISWPAGLVAVEAPENTRTPLFEALYERHAWGTTGARILLDLSFSQALRADTPAPFRVEVHGQAPLRQVSLERHRAGRGWDTAASWGPLDTADLTAEGVLEAMAAGDLVYLRVEQADGEMGWRGPWWAR